MCVRKGQSVIEYVLLVVIVIIALIAGTTLGKGGKMSFNSHFSKAAEGYFRSGGIPPKSE